MRSQAETVLARVVTAAAFLLLGKTLSKGQTANEVRIGDGDAVDS